MDFVLLSTSIKIHVTMNYRYLLWACCAPLAICLSVCAAHGETPPDPLFVYRDVLGWQVIIDRAAMQQQPEMTARGLEHLRQQLFQTTLVVPAENVAELRRVPIWLGHDQAKLGIAFHPQRGWLTSHGYLPPQRRSQIGIQSSRVYLHESLRQPWLVFHELCHGFDWFTIGGLREYGNALKVDRYRAAMKSGKYVSALHWDSRIRKPYHATNHMEFFAETSEAFFGTNDIYPFVRAELRDHDPQTFRMLSELWAVDLAQETEQESQLIALLREAPTVTLDAKNAAVGPAAVKLQESPGQDYRTLEIEGWQIYVHRAIAHQKLEETKLTDRMRRDLHYAKRYLPAAAVERLQAVPIWVERESKSSAFVTYHASQRWLRQNGHAKKLFGAIEIGNAEAYQQHFCRQPSILLHALACAYHHQVLGYDNPQVKSLFEEVSKCEQLDSVLRFDGKRVSHPGLETEQRMFAELSETRYGTNDHYPFVKAELQKMSPDITRAVEALWRATETTVSK